MVRVRAALMPLLFVTAALPVSTLQLTIVEQTLHARHRPPPGQRHVEVPERVFKAKEALLSASFSDSIIWKTAIDSKECTPQSAVDALKLVHSVEHLRAVIDMSKTGGGFDSDTYCAPGSWEAMLDGVRAWMQATSMAAAGAGPAFALSRPAGHHATRETGMGFGLVNFAAAAVAAELAAAPPDAPLRVAILDWDVHHGNGVAALFAGDKRVRYCSLHEAGGFPQTGMDEDDRGLHGNLLSIPLPKGSGSEEYLAALRHKAVPFLLGSEERREALPDLLVVCAGYDALEADPLATMALAPSDFGESIQILCGEHNFPVERIALGLEGGYSLDDEAGMPAAVVATCAALLNWQL